MKRTCVVHRNTTAKPVLGSPPDGHTHLSADLLLSQYGVNGTLDEAGLQEAFAAIISCQVLCTAAAVLYSRMCSILRAHQSCSQQ